MAQASEETSSARKLERVEKIKHIAYRLWLVRRDSRTPGSAERDYYQAERILRSQKTGARLGSFGFWTLAFLLGRLTEEQFTSGLTELSESPGAEVEEGASPTLSRPE